MTTARQMKVRRVARKVQVGGSEVRLIPATRTRDNVQGQAAFVPGEGERRVGKFPGLDRIKQQREAKPQQV